MRECVIPDLCSWWTKLVLDLCGAEYYVTKECSIGLYTKHKDRPLV